MGKISKGQIYELAKDIPLDEYGKQYLKRLHDLPEEDSYLKAQALYIANNSFPRTPKEKAKYEALLRIGGLSQSEIDRAEDERISMSFEKYTEHKVNAMSQYDDFADLETTRVMKCQGNDNELKIKGSACYVMNPMEYGRFTDYSRDTQKDVRRLARDGIVVFDDVIRLVRPNSRNPQIGYYRPLDEIVSYCQEKSKEPTQDYTECVVKSVSSGEVMNEEGKEIPIEEILPYHFTRDDKGRARKGLFHNFFEEIVDNDRENNRELWDRDKILEKEEINKLIAEHESRSEQMKINMSDFRKFADTHGYDIDRVLANNPWQESVLADDVKKRLGQLKGEW